MFEKTKINEKEAEDGPFLKKYSDCILDGVSSWYKTTSTVIIAIRKNPPCKHTKYDVQTNHQSIKCGLTNSLVFQLHIFLPDKKRRKKCVKKTQRVNELL